MGFQAAGVEAPPTRQRPHPPFPLLPPSWEKHPMPQGLLTSPPSAGLVDKLKVWPQPERLSLLDLSLAGEHLSWWPGSHGSSTLTPAALLPHEHQPLPSPAMGPFTLHPLLSSALLMPSVWVFPPRHFSHPRAPVHHPQRPPLTSDLQAHPFPELLPLCILELPLPSPSSLLPAAQHSRCCSQAATETKVN